jgi:hypothetical protein
VESIGGGDMARVDGAKALGKQVAGIVIYYDNSQAWHEHIIADTSKRAWRL